MLPRVDFAIVHIISVMMQRDRVELFEGIGDFTTGRGEAAVKWDTFHLAGGKTEAFVRAGCGGGGAEVDRVRFFHVTEVDRVDAAALVGNDWGF